MDANVTVVTAQKVRKKRISYKQEIMMLRKLPKAQRLIVALKFVGVVLVAIGIEGIITHNWALAVAGFASGLVTSVVPIKVSIAACLACSGPLEKGQAICPRCGVPQL